MDINVQFETVVQVKRRLEAGFKQLRNKRIGELFSLLVYGTPVDTGQARGGWVIAPYIVEWPSGKLDPDGATTVAEGLASLEKIHHWANVYISNGEPHFSSLEGGWSKQAPSGIIKVILPAFKLHYGDVE